MRGQDHRGAGRVDGADELPHRAADLDVDAGSRLIEDQQLRLVHHRAGNHQPPLHAAGQRARLHLCLVPQAQLLQVLLRPFRRFLARDAVEAGLVHADVERLLELVEVDLLRHQPDQPHRRAAILVDRYAEHVRIAGSGVHQRGQDADQGGLAGTVGTEQGEKIAGLHGQADAFQRFDAVAVGFAQIVDDKRGGRIWILRGHGLHQGG